MVIGQRSIVVVLLFFSFLAETTVLVVAMQMKAMRNSAAPLISGLGINIKHTARVSNIIETRPRMTRGGDLPKRFRRSAAHWSVCRLPAAGLKPARCASGSRKIRYFTAPRCVYCSC